MKRTVISACIATLFLYGCGGGGGAAVTSPIADVPLFASTPTLLPDLRSKYDSLCGDRVNVQNAVAIDLNRDGRQDLVFNLWCGVAQNGTPYTGSVPNTLVAFTQNADGSWTDSTATVFGSNTVDLGGVGIRAVVSDLNNDGYQDIVFAVNREDGRSSTDNNNTNQKAQNAVVLSQGNGTYRVSNIGQVAWNYGILLKDNEQGRQDIVSVPFGPQETYRFTGNSWSLLNGYDWVTESHSLFFKNSTGANKAVVPASYPNIGLELWTANNGSWSRSDTQLFGAVSMVNWISWQGNTGSNRLLSLDGKRYVSPSISNSCELKINPSASPMAVTVFSGLEVNETSYASSTDSARNQFNEGGGYFNTVVRLIGYDTANNRLSRINFTIAGEKTDVSDYRMTCEDVNRDGYDDIVITDWRSGTKPIIYINNKQGGFAAVKDSSYPTPNSGYNVNLYVDIDGDGIRDLVHWPIAGTGNTKVQFQIFKGRRFITTADMQ